MRAALLAALVLLSCYINALLPNVVDASNEAEHLRRFIASWRSGHDSLSGWSSDALHPVYMGPQEGMMEADRIESLPGQPKGISFVQYSGYVTVDPSAGRALFYYFVESPQNSSSKPLLLWLNGGPGCSSLGGGAMTELGPFRPNSDGKTLQSNAYAWNNVANVIFLESPAGVGFSYSNTSSDYVSSGDKRTATDAYTFLVNWLERFPQYNTRDFFIAGESYAGHYIPELASTILKNNKITSHTVINFKGIAMGNAYVDYDSTNKKATYNYFWTHALISEQAYKAIQSSCDFSGSSDSYSGDCFEAMMTADEEVGNINRYNVYSPLCHEPSKSMDQTVSSKDVDPCLGDYVVSYLNLPEAQKALHANVTGLSFPWNFCSVIRWNDYPTTMLPTIKDLIASGIRVWMYSGDQDSVISVTSTRDSIDMLSVSVKNSWRPWYSNNEVGGYVVDYEGLTFATIRGAGHMVPGDQAERALTFISSFLKGVLPPSA